MAEKGIDGIGRYKINIQKNLNLIIMNKNKEAVLLSKLILGIAFIVTAIIFPPIILITIILWAGWIVFNNYMDTR
tara:strand:- start:6468 stop:6692 length:225 start_codon:yes stop_codon:yes gene_type:complete